MIKPVGDDDARPVGFDYIRGAAVAGLFKKEKGLLHHLIRKNAAEGCMSFTDTSP